MVAIQELHVAGFATCQFTLRAKAAAARLAKEQPELFSFDDCLTFETRGKYKCFLASEAVDEPFADVPRALEHTACPFVWMNNNDFIGGSREMVAFVEDRIGEEKAAEPELEAEAKNAESVVAVEKTDEANPLAETVKLQGERITSLESELASLKAAMLEASSIFAAATRSQIA